MKLITLLGMMLAASPAVAGEGDYYLSVPLKGAIMRVDSVTKQASPFATGVMIPHYGTFVGDTLYVPDRFWPAVLKIGPSGVPSFHSAAGLFVKPVTVIADPGGNGLIVSDAELPGILRVGFDGSQTLLHDAVSTNGLLTGPDGLAFDDDGNLYAANLVGDTIIKIDPQGNASLFSDSPLISNPGGLALDGSGNLFAAMYANSTVVRFRTDTGEGEVFAQDVNKMNRPSDLKLARSGGLLATSRSSTVVRIDALGQVEVMFKDETFGDIVGIAVPEDGTFCTGRFEQYGAGLAGSGGFTPELRAIFSPCAGQQIALELVDFLGGTPAGMFLGLNPTSLPALGGTLLVDLSTPYVQLPLALPGQGAGDGDLVLPFMVPQNPGLVGLQLYYQVLAVDAAAPAGVSFSNGLKETIGI